MVDIVKVALWLIVLSGGWTVARRLRRLEHTFRSPGSDQDIEQVAAEVRLLLRRQERGTRLLAQRLAQLEQRLGTRPTPRVADRVG
jgi:hypothetical protein